MSAAAKHEWTPRDATTRVDVCRWCGCERESVVEDGARVPVRSYAMRGSAGVRTFEAPACPSRPAGDRLTTQRLGGNHAR